MTTLRQDIFTVVHKAIRALLYDLGAQLQQTELSQPEQAEPVLTRLAIVLDMVREHARHEDRFIFNELRGRAPALTDTFSAEHAAIESLVDELGVLADAMRRGDRERPAGKPGAELNRYFNTFMASYLAHMNREEAELLPLTWQYFSDEEIGAMRARIQKDTDPARYNEWLRWMFVSQTQAELTALFSGVKHSAPPAVLHRMTEVASATLGKQRWHTVRHAAGLR